MTPRIRIQISISSLFIHSFKQQRNVNETKMFFKKKISTFTWNEMNESGLTFFHTRIMYVYNQKQTNELKILFNELWLLKIIMMMIDKKWEFENWIFIININQRLHNSSLALSVRCSLTAAVAILTIPSGNIHKNHIYFFSTKWWLSEWDFCFLLLLFSCYYFFFVVLH